MNISTVAFFRAGASFTHGASFAQVCSRESFLKVSSPKLRISKLNMKSTSGFKILKIWI
jgi:hypothetical protein